MPAGCGESTLLHAMDERRHCRLAQLRVAFHQVATTNSGFCSFNVGVQAIVAERDGFFGNFKPAALCDEICNDVKAQQQLEGLLGGAVMEAPQTRPEGGDCPGDVIRLGRCRECFHKATHISMKRLAFPTLQIWRYRDGRAARQDSSLANISTECVRPFLSESLCDSLFTLL